MDHQRHAKSLRRQASRLAYIAREVSRHRLTGSAELTLRALAKWRSLSGMRVHVSEDYRRYYYQLLTRVQYVGPQYEFCRSEEHTSELQSRVDISYAVF